YLALDVLPKRLVAFDAFATGRRQLHEDGIVALGPPFGQQLCERFQPHVDALGVVEPVDTQQDLARVTQFRPYLAGVLANASLAPLVVEFSGVDRDREGADPNDPRTVIHLAEPRTDADRSARRVRSDEPPSQDEEVLRTPRQLEADQIGAE